MVFTKEQSGLPLFAFVYVHNMYGEGEKLIFKVQLLLM